VGERGEVPDEMGAGAEELEGERGVALLGELVVEEDVRGAEEDGVAVAGGGRDAQQGGEALAGVALVGRDVGGGVAEAADVGAARAAGGGQGAVGGESGVEAGGRGGGDAGGEAFHGGAAGGDQHGPAAGVGGGVVQPGLLGRGQQVGDGDQERGVGTGRGGGVLQGGDHAGVHAAVGEEFGDGPAAVRVGGARVECAVAGVGADHGDHDGTHEQQHQREGDAARAGPHLAGGGRGRGGRKGGLGRHPAAPRLVSWSVPWAPDVLPASRGLLRSRSSSRPAMARYASSVAVRPPYVTSSKPRAAARRRSVWAGRARAASVAASSAVRPGRRSSRARSSRERTMARMRSWTAWFQWPWAACASAAARCSAALRGRSSNRAGAETGWRRGVPRRRQSATTTGMRAGMATGRPRVPPGVGVEAASKKSPTQSQGALRALWNQLGSFSWYMRLDSSRRAASRAGSRGMVTGGSSPPARMRTAVPVAVGSAGTDVRTPPAVITLSAPRGGVGAGAVEAGGAGQVEVGGLAADALVDVEQHGDAGREREGDRAADDRADAADDQERPAEVPAGALQEA